MAAGKRTMIGAAAGLLILAAMGGTMVSLRGCDEKTDPGITTAKIAGKTFYLEVAAEDKVRYKGMGGRTHIEDDGGMIFLFATPLRPDRGFVMRDCVIPIDILYLDGAGRVLTTHTMIPEDARGANERATEPAEDDAYNKRLKEYRSRYPYQMVIELQGGLIQKLGVKEGDLVHLKVEELKKLVK